MAQPLYIPEDMQHPTWLGQLPDAVQSKGMNLANIDTASWTVKLEFSIGGKEATGSGFFINIPQSLKAVILTAGHNLMGPDGTRSTNLAVLEPDGSTDAVTKYTVQDGDVHVAGGFTGEHGKPALDWGVILYPRERLKGARKGAGFGYSLCLNLDRHDRRTAFVHGYQGATPPGYPDTSSGPLVEAYRAYLEYRLRTAQGISGSVVWTEYQGWPTAIAIHNHSPDATRKSAGSRGTRITAEVLREVFHFANVGHYSVRLRAHGIPRQLKLLPKRGLYLSFPEGFPFARVRLGPGTVLDILPVEISRSVERYAMAVGGQWALFNTSKQQVTLSADVREECLFTIDEKVNKKSNEPAIEIVISGENKPKLQLRIQGEKLKCPEDEPEDEDAESSEVSMVPYPCNDTYVRFALEATRTAPASIRTGL